MASLKSFLSRTSSEIPIRTARTSRNIMVCFLLVRLLVWLCTWERGRVRPCEDDNKEMVVPLRHTSRFAL